MVLLQGLLRAAGSTEGGALPSEQVDTQIDQTQSFVIQTNKIYLHKSTRMIPRSVTSSRNSIHLQDPGGRGKGGRCWGFS